MFRLDSCLVYAISLIAASSCGWIGADQAAAQNQVIVDEQFDDEIKVSSTVLVA